jgi:hypothetical protein
MSTRVKRSSLLKRSLQFYIFCRRFIHSDEKRGPNVIKLFTAVIYCHSMVIPSFCVIKQHYLGNYSRMAINYRGICVTNVIKYNLT